MPPTWHVLQLSDALDLELASALAESVPVNVWEPDRSLLPMRPGYREKDRHHPDSPLRIRSFPLLRGFSRFPVSLFFGTGAALAARIADRSDHPEQSPLVCTTPYFAHVCEAWPGPVVYWLTDFIAEYAGANHALVTRLDRLMCQAATLVCPNSERLAKYLIEQAGCDPAKIKVLPNAARAASILPHPPSAPAPLPVEFAHLPRPVAGVIGNLAGNTDWPLLEKLLQLTPQLSWAFVGSTEMVIPNKEHCRARTAVMRNERACFSGRRPYGELVNYARSFDVAVLPYLGMEPTYSGSSTRYYEHLAACRPMIAFPGVHELRSKAPLLELADTANEAAEAMARLHAVGFDDGLIGARWQASQKETWQMRATAMQNGLRKRNAAD